MMLGFALAAVGIDTVTGTLRMTFGQPAPAAGLRLPGRGDRPLRAGRDPAHDGGRARVQGQEAKIDFAIVLADVEELPAATGRRRCARCLVGCWMGITPGGATPASFMSYGMARRFSKNRQNSATARSRRGRAGDRRARRGHQRAAADADARHPGSPTAAVLLGGLLIWGLQPGPLLFVEKKDFVWGLIASMYLGNIVGLLIVLTTVPWWAAILRIPFSIIAPVIVVICAIGAYTVHNNMFDVG